MRMRKTSFYFLEKFFCRGYLKTSFTLNSSDFFAKCATFVRTSPPQVAAIRSRAAHQRDDKSRLHFVSGHSSGVFGSRCATHAHGGTSVLIPVTALTNLRVTYEWLSSAIMLNYGEGPTPVTQTRVNRRRTTDQRFSCSQQSVLSAIDRFVKAVNNMDATVLVPSRLKDMEVQNRRKNCPPPPGLQHQDLYSFYTMLKDVKNELLWGPTSLGSTLFPVAGSLSGMSSPRRPPTSMMSMSMSMTTGMTMGMSMGMTMGMTTPRQPSDDGLGSSTGCSSDQDTDSDFESIMTDRDSMIMEQTSHLATAFRHHLHGLHAILHQLADSADYLSNRYQEEIEASSA